MFERRPSARVPEAVADAELVTIADRRSLIVVNRAVFKSLPGVNIIPLSGDRAFLALEPGQGMANLEVAVIDRLEDRSVNGRERQALAAFRNDLRKWRHDAAMRFHTRAIIVVEHVKARGRSAPV